MCPDFYAPACDLIIAIDKQRHRFGVETMLFDQDARGESVGRIVVKHRNDRLRDDRAAVERFVNEVDCAAAPFNAVLNGLTMRVEAGK